MKIKLNKRIKSVSGQEIQKETNQGVRNVTIRDALLTVLGLEFTPKDEKELFWTQDLGIKFSDMENDFIEISDNKVAFLKRIIREIAIEKGKGKNGRVLIKPFVAGQLLKELSKENESETE
ncbi:MAG: hypothetical protein ACOCTT_03705 [archaeon]